MYEFKDWAEEIAAVTTAQEFQNCTVSISDPSLATIVDDPDSDELTYTGDTEVYAGPARVVGVRWGVNRENNQTNNATTLTSVRVQLANNATGRLKRGMKMKVTDCATNPVLETYWFTLTSDFQGSHVASRTLEFAVDGDAVV